MSHYLEVYDDYAVVIRIDPEPTPAQFALDLLCGLLHCVVFSALFALAWGAFAATLIALVRAMR